NREDLAVYRGAPVLPDENRALAACAAFAGDVLLVESEHDHLVPHATIMSYRSAFGASHSMTHRVIDGADHALSEKTAQEAYTSV
ncbi:alpha/beta hydrolase, partial [Ciceribacter ferrooxidans]